MELKILLEKYVTGNVSIIVFFRAFDQYFFLGEALNVATIICIHTVVII
jgi:hypothetical protein